MKRYWQRSVSIARCFVPRDMSGPPMLVGLIVVLPLVAYLAGLWLFAFGLLTYVLIFLLVFASAAGAASVPRDTIFLVVRHWTSRDNLRRLQLRPLTLNGILLTVLGVALFNLLLLKMHFTVLASLGISSAVGTAYLF